MHLHQQEHTETCHLHVKLSETHKQTNAQDPLLIIMYGVRCPATGMFSALSVLFVYCSVFVLTEH